MERDEIARVVDDFFQEEVGDMRHVERDTDLIETGILDSMMMVLLISHCEEGLDIELDVEDLTEENFRSLDAITEMLATKGVAP